MLITTSSKDMAKDSMAPERIPGRIAGNVTSQKTRNLDAPRSSAASSSYRSIPASLVFTMEQI